jgi:hypothetical protein
MDPFLAL